MGVRRKVDRRLLPEIVALIKATNPSVAAIGLHTAMHSPKVRDCFRVFTLLTPSVVVPGYPAYKLYADAAGLPIGEVRKKAAANLKQAAKEGALTKALTMEDAVKIFEEFAKEEGEASPIARGAPASKPPIEFEDEFRQAKKREANQPMPVSQN